MPNISTASVTQSQLSLISQRKKSLEDEVKGTENMYFFSKIFININRKNEKIRILTKIYEKIKSDNAPIKDDGDLLKYITRAELTILKKGIFSRRTFNMLEETYKKHNTDIIQLAHNEAVKLHKNFSKLVDEYIRIFVEPSGVGIRFPTNIIINQSESLDYRARCIQQFAYFAEKQATDTASTAKFQELYAKSFLEVANERKANLKHAAISLDQEAKPVANSTPTSVPNYYTGGQSAQNAFLFAYNAQKIADRAKLVADEKENLARQIRPYTEAFAIANKAIDEAIKATEAPRNDFIKGFDALTQAQASYEKLLSIFVANDVFVRTSDIHEFTYTEQQY